MTHGFGMFAATYFELIKRLHKYFRLILFDNTGFGANTRISTCSGLESPQKANQFLSNLIEKLIEELDKLELLPNKFHLYGHSNGGYQMGNFASKVENRKRIASLFLESPSGTSPFPSNDTYNPYNERN